MKEILSNFLRFFISRAFWFNVAAIILVSVLFFWLVLTGLDSYTNHGESIEVPDLKGMTLKNAVATLEDKHLRYKIMDSTYNGNMLPRAIIDQTPEANSNVKEERHIYLTINASIPPSTEIPNLAYTSLINAKIQLDSRGLILGEVRYVPWKNKVVLKAFVDGKLAEEGDVAPKGTKVDLEVGNGVGNLTVPIPNLIGLTLREARIVLEAQQLNIGASVPNEGVVDNENAYIYRQQPAQNPFGDKMINIGEPIDVYLQNEEPNQFFDDTPPPNPFDASGFDTQINSNGNGGFGAPLRRTNNDVLDPPPGNDGGSGNQNDFTPPPPVNDGGGNQNDFTSPPPVNDGGSGNQGGGLPPPPNNNQSELDDFNDTPKVNPDALFKPVPIKTEEERQKELDELLAPQ